MSSNDEFVVYHSSTEPLTAKLLQVLANWQKADNDLTPLTALWLFRQAAQAHNGDAAHALNQLLGQALAVLARTHPVHAQLLQSRLLGQEKIDMAARRLHLSLATFYRKQKEALPLLSAILTQLEAEARQQYADRMMQRLEPPTYGQLIGNEDALQRLTSLLLTNDAPWLLAITGIGGIGKTALADQVLRRLIATAVWDEIGWVTARQTVFNAGGAITPLPSPALTTHALVAALTNQLLGDDAQRVPRTSDETLALLTQQLKSRPHLVVIDNLETVLDLAQLLPILRRLANPSKFLLTTRMALFDEPDLYHLAVPELPETAALALVRQEAHARNIAHVTAAADADLRPLYTIVGGNPLALRLLTGQLRFYPLALLLADLAAARSDNVEALYAFIYRQAWFLLDAAARDVLMTMPLVSEQGGRFDLLAAMSDLAEQEVRAALEQLVTLNLVDMHGDLHERRYTIHSLTRTFLQEQVLRWQGA
ncbi:MAG: hypothetical protein DYG89_18685 [Caldilinea sp. CFX5]|nr:hypothetical protein [Caldilinea sp. CFX5]